MLSVQNFLGATSDFSHFSSASVWALPKGHSCFRFPTICSGMDPPQAAGEVPALPWRPLPFIL